MAVSIIFQLLDSTFDSVVFALNVLVPILHELASASHLLVSFSVESSFSGSLSFDDELFTSELRFHCLSSLRNFLKSEKYGQERDNFKSKRLNFTDSPKLSSSFIANSAYFSKPASFLTHSVKNQSLISLSKDDKSATVFHVSCSFSCM
jgi:hypothetical protein